MRSQRVGHDLLTQQQQPSKAAVQMPGDDACGQRSPCTWEICLLSFMRPSRLNTSCSLVPVTPTRAEFDHDEVGSVTGTIFPLLAEFSEASAIQNANDSHPDGCAA